MTNRCGYPKGCARLRDGAGGSPAAATGPMQELVAWARGVVGRQLKVPQGRTLGRASESQGWTPSQGHGAALHGGSSCKVRWSMLPRPQRAQLSAAHCPRRAGVERSTSSTSSFNASTGTASAWRRPPALLGRRPDATTGRLGPVAAHAVRLVPSAASVRACQVSALLALLLR